MLFSFSIIIIKEFFCWVSRQMSELKTKDEIEQPVTLVMPDSAVSSWKRGDSNLNAKVSIDCLDSDPIRTMIQFLYFLLVLKS